MQKPMLVIADSRLSSTECPRATAMAGDELGALLVVPTQPTPAPGHLVLGDVGDPVTFRPERAPGLDPAGLKWGSPTGRKDDG